MKKILTKALSVFLSALMLFSATAVIGFAADPDLPIPAISVKKVSETKTDVVIAIVLEENEFSSLDMTISSADGLTLSKITFDNSLEGAHESNTATGMISLASTTPIAAPQNIASYTFTKNNASGVTLADFTVEITACYVEVDDVGKDICEAIVVDNQIPATHTHIASGDWVVTTPVTCGTDGEEVRYCSECGEVAEANTLTATGNHINTTPEHLDATCTVDGYDKIYCNDCKQYISETTLPATGHVDTHIEKTEPTCTVEGAEKVVCACGEVVSSTPIPATGHTNTHIEKTEPTCTVDGVEKVVCACGEVISYRVLEALGHSLLVDKKEATCTEDGYNRVFCTACELVTDYLVEPKTGHSFLVWQTIKPATYASTGIERRVCDKCGLDEEREIPRLELKATELLLSQHEIAMNFKQTGRLFVTIIPENAAYSTVVVWESSNEKVATVDEDGQVYAAGLGTATITAKTEDGTVMDTCEVTVKYSILQWIIVYILFGWIWYI